VSSRENRSNIFGWELVVGGAGEQYGDRIVKEPEYAGHPARASELTSILVDDLTGIIQSSSALSTVADKTISLEEPVLLQFSCLLFSASGQPSSEHQGRLSEVLVLSKYLLVELPPKSR